jgi:hypothetical protein
MANRKPKEKDEINQLLDNFDLHGMRQDEIAGPNGLAKQLPLCNDQIISMYAFGMSCRDIQSHLKQVYGVAVSPELITRVTDSVASANLDRMLHHCHIISLQADSYKMKDRMKVGVVGFE